MNSENDAQNMDKNFYRAFEDKFRGTREMIQSRLTVYLPFISQLIEIYDICNAIDLGCGRGEWLELITKSGMTAHGVDLDDGMLEACRERGLSVETSDAISYLKSVPDESQVLVTGFHFVEHIPHNDVKILVQEALRVLKPAGLLILETPNPENITVGTSSFYLDPTHLNPIPPRLLAFLSDYYGFHRTKIIRLQEPADLGPGRSVNLKNVFTDVSLDYAIVAQKRAEPKLLEDFDPLFAAEYGISMDAMLARYDAMLARHDAEEAMLTQRLDVLETETQKEINALRAELNGIYYSRSWQITQPLRWLALQRQLLKKDGLYVRSKTVFRRLFLRSNTRPSSGQSHETPKTDKDSPGSDIDSKKGQLPQQTKRDLHPIQPTGIGGKFKRVARSWLVATIKLVSDFARRVPGLKRLTFRILNRLPNLELKLRRYNQESKSGSQLKTRAWYGAAIGSQVLDRDVPYTARDSAELNSASDGINASQRTPLEANHYKYRKNA